MSMSRMELVEALTKNNKWKEATEQQSSAVISSTLAQLNQEDPATVAAYMSDEAGYKQLLKDAESYIFAEMMTSDLDDDELQKVYDFMSSELGKKWRDVRTNAHGYVLRMLEQYAHNVGIHYSNIMYIRLQSYLIKIIQQLKPNTDFDTAMVLVNAIMIDNEMYTANEEVAAVAKKEAPHVWRQCEQTGG